MTAPVSQPPYRYLPSLPPPSGIDDTAAFQAVLNANNGGVISVPAGTFMVSALTVPSNGITLIGQGWTSVIQQLASTNNHLLACSTTGADLIAERVCFDANQANQTNDAGHAYDTINFTASGGVSNPSNLVLHGCLFINGRRTDVNVLVADATSTQRLVVQDCMFFGGIERTSGNPTACGYIHVAGPVDQLIQGNVFDFGSAPVAYGRFGIDGEAISVPDTNTASANVTGNRFNNVGQSIMTGTLGAIDYYSSDAEVSISGNVIRNGWGRGINVKADDGGVSITGNTIYGLSSNDGSQSAQIVVNASVTTVVNGTFAIVGNTLRSSGNDAISISGFNTNQSAFAKLFSVTGNSIISPARRGVGVIDAPDTVISGNTIYGGTDAVFASPIIGGLSIVGNVFDSQSNGGVNADSTSGAATGTILVNSNAILSAGNRAIDIQYVAEATVVGNQIIGAGSGGPMRIQNTTGPSRVSGNICTGSNPLIAATGIGSNAALWVEGNYSAANWGASNILLSVASNTVLAWNSRHTVDTSSGVQQINTINGGPEDTVLTISASTASHAATFKDGVGNLSLNGDFVTASVNDFLTLRKAGSNWVEISRSANG